MIGRGGPSPRVLDDSVLQSGRWTRLFRDSDLQDHLVVGISGAGSVATWQRSIGPLR